MDEGRGMRTLLVVAAAALGAVAAVSWRAAEESRGLDLADLRSVVVVAAAVWVATWVMGRRG